MAATQEKNPDRNLLDTMYALDSSMVTEHSKKDADDASRKHAEDTATILLEYPGLPLLIRARAEMVLGCSDTPGFLEHAKEAVRIAQLGIKNSTNVTDLERDLLESSEFVLKEALEASGGGGEIEEAADAEQADEELDGELVIVWKDGKPIVIKDETGSTISTTAQDLGGSKEVDPELEKSGGSELMEIDTKGSTSQGIESRTPKTAERETVTESMDIDDPESAVRSSNVRGIPKGKKIKSRRIDSGYADGEERVQHYDKATNGYVDAGTALDPMLVDEDEEDEMLLGDVGDEFDRV